MKNTFVMEVEWTRNKNIHKSQFLVTQREEDTCVREYPRGGQESKNQDGKNSTSQFYVADRCAVVDF